MDDLFSLLQTMPPEVQQQLLSMGTLDGRASLVGNQIAQAQALRRGKDYKTGGQATMGNLSGILGAIGERVGMDRQKSILDQKDSGRMAYASALANALRGQPNPQNPLAMAEAGAAVAAQNPDMGQLALPAQPAPNPGNAGMGDLGQAPQKGWGSAQVDPRLRQLPIDPFGFGYG